ncbi:MAG: SAM-dependent methyltransferase [Nonlabens sp.]|uniref:SAM-dependent methyltransferase n=1 Tax=Nonlabens sp. TaxID=1888209 RepID=UPI003EFA10AF
MKNLDKEYWQERYLTKSTGWDLGSISRPIKEYIDQLTDKNIKILIPGAGNAHEAIYLVNKGFMNIHILDLAQLPLKNAQQQIPELPSSSFINGDFFEHEGSYDLIIEQTFFCALEPRFRESYLKKNHELLNNNGTIAGVLFNFEHKVNEPPFGGSIDEYETLFKPYFEIAIMEPCYNSSPSRLGKELFIKLNKRTYGN